MAINEHWSEQYEATAKMLEAEANDETPGRSVGLLNRAADDIKTLVDGLKKREAEEEERLPFSDRPRYSNSEEINVSNLPTHVEYPIGYFPKGIGPGSFDPALMYLSALAYQGGMLHEYPMKSWSVLWLLDYVDWDKVRQTHQMDFKMENDNVST